MLNINDHQGYANQNHKISHTHQGGQYKKNTANNKCWQGCGEIETLCTSGGNVKWCSHYEKYGGSSKN